MDKVTQSWARKIILDTDLAEIEKAIQSAELRTSGEVVPMVVRSASVVGHVPVILTLLLILLSHTTAHFMGLYFDHYWETWKLLLLDVVWIGLAQVMSQSLLVQRHLTARFDRQLQVWERAEIEFYRHNLRATEHRTAILILLSVMERQAVVLADEAIAKRLPPETWQDVVNLVLAGVKKGRTSEGLQNAIHRSGEILAQHFPRKTDDQNEIKDRLIIKD